MKKALRSMFFIFSLVFLNVSFAIPKDKPMSSCQANGGWGKDYPHNQIFKRENISQIKGEVMTIETFVPESKMSKVQIIKIKTAKETISVHMGPHWYLAKQDLQVQITDKLEIKGVKALFNGKEIIIASEVIKKDKTLVLRDSTGTPLWSGGHSRVQPKEALCTF